VNNNQDVALQDSVATDTLKALSKFNPQSVFLYGSRGREEARPDSDYEIGVIFDDDKYVQRSDIHAAITNPKVKAYPFKWGELSSGRFDFLFQKSIYLREIIQGGKTIAGEDLLVHIPVLSITTLDLVQDIRFSIARALDALLSFRSGDTPTSMELFNKSCFFGLRNLEILELKTFPLGYNQIYELSAKVVAEPEYREVIEAAHILRQTGRAASIDMLYENISLLDSLIEPKIVAAFKARGDEEII
jgi:predicted nucleotidyltransferase